MQDKLTTHFNKMIKFILPTMQINQSLKTVEGSKDVKKLSAEHDENSSAEVDFSVASLIISINATLIATGNTVDRFYAALAVLLWVFIMLKFAPKRYKDELRRLKFGAPLANISLLMFAAILLHSIYKDPKAIIQQATDFWFQFVKP